MRALLPLSLMAACLAAAPVLAEDNSIRVDAPYVRLAPPGAAATGAFMRISNSGAGDRQLIRADSPVAQTVELHTHVNENGMMKMRPVARIEIKAGSYTDLKPGSYHVMLIGMKQPLKDGDSVPITLTFDQGPQQQITAPVRPIHAEGMMPGGMKH